MTIAAIVIKILLLALVVEAITEIFVSSLLFEKLRIKIASIHLMLGELVHCGYCTSVWISMLVAWIATFILPISNYIIVDYILFVFILHRLSNIMHEIISKLLQRRPIQLWVHKPK